MSFRYYESITVAKQYFFKFFVSDYRRQVGNGRVGLGINHYLLDNLKFETLTFITTEIIKLMS